MSVTTGWEIPVQPWALDPAATVAALSTDPDAGLSADEVRRRREAVGPNALPEPPGKGIGALFVDQFRDVLIYLLLGAMVVSLVVGEPLDALVIAIIVIVNSVIGVVQAYRADQALAALQRLATPVAEVVRDGQAGRIEAADLVPGDVVLLSAGCGVPADVRLVTGTGVQAAEAALTGESVPVMKSPAAVPADTEVADRSSMLYRGTDVVAGAGRAVVVATGEFTQIGEIADLVAGAEGVLTPLQRRLARLGKVIAIAVVAVCIVVFLAGLLRGEDPVEMLLTAVSLAVAAVPEALPAVVTISLAQGASAMVRQAALTRRLPAVETLGSVTHICSDKTGTLTRNRMSVEEVWLVPGCTPRDAAQVAALCNDSHLSDDEAEPVGDPTEVALLQFARPLWHESGWQRRAEVPFDSTRMRMTTIDEGRTDGVWAFTKGAPEVLLPMMGADPSVSAEAHRMASSGLRVLVLARRRLGAIPADAAAVEATLEPVGLVGLLDPPREGVPEAIAQCETAGITAVMITGDHPATARAIAGRVGIPAAEATTLTGGALRDMSDAELAQRVGTVNVYARVDPSQKIRIVEALQADGKVAAMTGDGVNDAPALKQADIGVAMGEGGTDVARGAADLVLLDNNFATLVAAVRQGRRMYDNIRRFVKYVLTGNAGEIWTVFLAPFLGFPLALLPLQILWINLVTDGLPGLALTAEPAGADVMRRPPRPPQQSVFAGGMGAHIIWVGGLIGALSLTALAIGYDHGNWQTMVFTTLVLCQVVLAMAVRSETRSAFTIGLFSNRPMVWALGVTVLAQLLVIYWAPLQSVFRTQSLTASELATCVALAMVVFVAVEIEKAVRRAVAAHRLPVTAAAPPR